MTGDQLYTINTQLLSGATVDEDLFYQFLNMYKDMLESSRDWMILRTFDSSITFSSSDDYTSTKTLPARFLRTYTFYNSRGEEQPGVYIIDSAGNKQPLKPIKFEERFAYKDIEGFYYVDVKNSKIGRTGLLAGTLHLFFLQGSADIDTDSTWAFPSFAHPLLPIKVAIDQKGGIDWDTVNANQVPYNANTIKQIESALNMWDARLQQAELGI